MIVYFLMKKERKKERNERAKTSNKQNRYGLYKNIPQYTGSFSLLLTYFQSFIRK